MNKDHPRAAVLFNPEKLPVLHDPFAGGGGIPLEAQRLGLEAYASDLNPVAVMINKAMIEIPPKFAGRPPVGPLTPDAGEASLNLPTTWPGASGLAEDVRRYGAWIRAEAQRRIGKLYPPVEVSSELARERPTLKPLVGQRLTVIAWLWAHTVKSPSPAYSQVDVPLVSTFVLSGKEGSEAYLHPIVEGGRYRFSVKTGAPPPETEDGTKAKGAGANFRCIITDTPIGGDYLRAEAQAGRMGSTLLAVVVESSLGRIYLPATAEMEAVAKAAHLRGSLTWSSSSKPLGFGSETTG